MVFLGGHSIFHSLHRNRNRKRNQSDPGRDHDSELLREIGEQARTPFTYVEDRDSKEAAFGGQLHQLEWMKP